MFSSIDYRGRYAYGNQPRIAQWNLARLGEVILPLLDEDHKNSREMIEEALNDFGLQYEEKWLSMMRSKLGLFDEQEGDDSLITDLLDWMQRTGADYTNTFIFLTEDNLPQDKPYNDNFFKQWYARWKVQLAKNAKPSKSSFNLMRSNNPSIIPRNHQMEQVLKDANSGDLKPLKNFLIALKEPYEDCSDLKSYQSPPKEGELSLIHI